MNTAESFDLTMIALRMIHIFGAACWIGFTYFVAFFLLPALSAAGPASGAVLRSLVTRTKFSMAMSLSGAGTVVSGFLLMWKDSSGFDPAWMGSKTGMVYSTAALFGVISGAMGGHTGGTIGTKIMVLGRAVDAAGGSVTPEQTAELAALQARLSQAMRRTATTLTIALAGMIAARHIFV